MQKIIPFLWFNNNAKEAVDFYTSLFNDSKITNTSYYIEEATKASGIQKGSVMTLSFQLEGQDFIALNGGPEYQFTPAISFFVNCETEDELDLLWNRLTDGGGILMELGEYPFSKKYGWLVDKFGVSWQLSLNKKTQKIIPALLFVGEKFGKAKEAIDLYTSVFEDSKVLTVDPYTDSENREAIKYAEFALFGQTFIATESNLDHAFTFSPAISFLVSCESQEEVDNYWEKLTKEGTEGPCGWLEDKHGISWQIVPKQLEQMLHEENQVKAKRIMTAMLDMKKIDLQKLEDAQTGIDQ